jgi:hypothetical protein
MSTERQKQASRLNGSQSHGPVTPEGKLASSRNAEKHGLLSGTIVLEGESTDRFLSLVAALRGEFQPRTPFEESLIENMAIARWRQMRIWGIEKAGMDYEMRRQAALPNAVSATEDNATRAALAFRALSDDSRSIELMNRYDARCERQYYRAHRRLLEGRNRPTPPSHSPEPVNQQPGDETFPDGPQEADCRPCILEMPSVKKEDIFAKRTRQVAANKAPLSSPIRFHTRSSAAEIGFSGFDLAGGRSQPHPIPRL